MAFGIETRDGWYNIIREACLEAEPIIAKWLKDNPNEERDWAPRFAQVKEKYGTLRLYFTTYPDGISEIEMKAETKSETICETCGKPGKLRGQGWLYTSCIEHAKKGDADGLEVVEDAYVKKEKANDQ